MIYEFPMIQHLDDVRDAIKDSPEFIVVQKDGYQVVNYVVMSEETFPAVNVAGGSAEMRKERALRARLRRECRGLIFDMEGKIINRRYHKFFNVNEREETAAHRLNWSAPHVILEKLDGSMVSPCVVGGNVRWMTKMGITDTSMEAEVFVAQHPDYVEFAERYLSHGMTPIFEWCSRKQRIVVDYPEDQLVLIAMRRNVTGEYLPYDVLSFNGDYWHIPVVKTYDGTTSNMESLIADARGREDQEGYIIRFDDGHMLKIKGDWYVRIHKTKDNLTLEKNVVDLLVNEKVDDAKAFMLEDDRKRVEEFEDKFWHGVAEVTRLYEDYFHVVIRNQNMDRREWAMTHLDVVKKQNVFSPQIIFGMFDGKKVHDLIVDAIRKNTGTQTRIDGVRHLWRGARWSYHFEGDN